MLAAVAILWFVVRPGIAWATTTYTFTNRRFMKRSGLIAKEGRTVTVLPHIAIVDDLNDGSLVALPLNDVEVEEARIALVHRVGRQLEGVPGRMLTTLQGRFRALFEVGPPQAVIEAA